jgi:hypothetical protein
MEKRGALFNRADRPKTKVSGYVRNTPAIGPSVDPASLSVNFMPFVS